MEATPQYESRQPPQAAEQARAISADSDASLVFEDTRVDEALESIREKLASLA